MEDYGHIIKSICDSIEILDDFRYKILDNIHVVTPQYAYVEWNNSDSTFGSNMPKGDTRLNMIEAVANSIYQYFYSTGTLKPDLAKLSQSKTNDPVRQEQLDYMSHLSVHNNTRENDDLYWQVVDINMDQYVIEKNGNRRILKKGEYTLADQESRVDIGTYVHLHKWKEDRNLQSAFYYVYSDQWMVEDVDVVRFYVNIDPLYSHVLVDELTSKLNKYQVPFTFKCLNHPTYYETRSDCAIIYVDKYYHHISWQIISAILDNVRPYLRPLTPIFSYPVKEGIGFAEDPGHTKSFGMSRCKIVAELIWEAYKNDEQVTNQRISETFDAYGIDVQKVYLNSKNGMPYSFLHINK